MVDTTLDFTPTKAQHSEELVGPLSETRELRVLSSGTVITLEGEKEVTFKSGGWCVQRAMGAKKESEGALRFWLDCEAGAARGDVSVEPGERLFFTTSVWDDVPGIERLTEFKQKTEAQLVEFNEEQELKKQEKQQRAEEGLRAGRRDGGLSLIHI